jgi:hypothetical protein
VGAGGVLPRPGGADPRAAEAGDPGWLRCTGGCSRRRSAARRSTGCRS